MPLDRDLYERVCRLLWEEWDPIGVKALGGPNDEYDSYAAGLIRLVQSGADEFKVAGQLTQIEEVSMGLSCSQGDEPRRQDVAWRLIHLMTAE